MKAIASIVLAVSYFVLAAVYYLDGEILMAGVLLAISNVWAATGTVIGRLG